MGLTWGHFFLLTVVGAICLWEGITLTLPRYDPSSVTYSIRWSLKYGAIAAGVGCLLGALRILPLLAAR
jgi:hypothetical protein